MIVAFTYWEKRIAPVFDVAGHLLIAEILENRVIHKNTHLFPQGAPHVRRTYLEDLGVETLVCGAISKPLQQVLENANIQVIPFVAGELEEVIQAWLEKRLTQDRFAMPGCCGRNRRRNGRKLARGNRERSESNETCGFCICSQCGRETPHPRGVPCAQMKCPQCGGAMIRQENSNKET